MSRGPQPRNQKSANRYGGERNLPSMATPRKPEPPNRVGFVGLIFMLSILGGVVWLFMLIFGWGPYQQESLDATPTLTQTPILISILSHTATSTQTASTAETLSPAVTETVTPTPTQELRPFVLDGAPEALPSVLIRPQLSCDWLVIAGQVWDLEGDPIIGLTLHLYGELGDYEIDHFVLSGSENAIAYGESGYEFALEGLLINSKESLFIQLVDTNGLPLSLPYTIQTFNDCQSNLILVNFKQVRSQ